MRKRSGTVRHRRGGTRWEHGRLHGEEPPSISGRKVNPPLWARHMTHGSDLSLLRYANARRADLTIDRPIGERCLDAELRGAQTQNLNEGVGDDR